MVYSYVFSFINSKTKSWWFFFPYQIAIISFSNGVVSWLILNSSGFIHCKHVSNISLLNLLWKQDYTTRAAYGTGYANSYYFGFCFLVCRLRFSVIVGTLLRPSPAVVLKTVLVTMTFWKGNCICLVNNLFRNRYIGRPRPITIDIRRNT